MAILMMLTVAYFAHTRNFGRDGNIEHALRYGLIIHCSFHSCHPLPTVLPSIRPAIRRTKKPRGPYVSPIQLLFCSATCTAQASRLLFVLHECNMA